MENVGLNYYIRVNICDTTLYGYPILQDYRDRVQDCRIVGMLVAQEKWISVFGMLLIQHAKATEIFFDGLQLSLKRPGFQKTSKELIFPNNSTFLSRHSSEC